jgi:hypothetical protein
VAVVLHPGVSFDGIGAALGGQGFRLSAVDQSPLTPGEPGHAIWRNDGAVVSYSFQPIVELRVLRVSPPRLASELAASLPVLTANDIGLLLEAPNHRDLVLGILAAGEMEDGSHLARITALAGHEGPMVSGAARRFITPLLEAGAKRLDERLRNSSAASVYFPLLGDAATRLSVLRALPARDGAVEILRAALQDENWEVRASAMILAVRRRAKDCLALVERLASPTRAIRAQQGRIVRYWGQVG